MFTQVDREHFAAQLQKNLSVLATDVGRLPIRQSNKLEQVINA